MMAIVTTAIEIVIRMALTLVTVVLIFSKPWARARRGVEQDQRGQQQADAGTGQRCGCRLHDDSSVVE